MQIENIIRPKIDTMLFSTLRQTSAALIKSLFTISVILIAWGMYIVDVEAVPVKWHPGHYVTLVNPGKDSSYYMNKVYTELNNKPALRGVTIRYKWPELEPKEGVYDFSSIDHHLAELTKRKKRLIILLETKSFDPDFDLVPNYLRTPAYAGGEFAFSSSGSKTIKGYNIKLWNQQVHDRLAALVRVLGNRYNSKANFEGFGLTETAMGQPMTPISDGQVDEYYNNLLSINRVARNNFPNTMTFQFTNYPRQVVAPFVNQLKATGGALGCPDVFIDEPGLLFKGTADSPPGVYTHYPKNANAMPLTIQIEKSNYENTRHDGTGTKPTVNELLVFAREKLHVNYIFWTRSPGYYNNVLEMLSQKAQTSNAAGGLNPTCPNSYDSCIN